MYLYEREHMTIKIYRVKNLTVPYITQPCSFLNSIASIPFPNINIVKQLTVTLTKV